MKSYTDIEQSRKLAEILPHESADMYWMHGKLDNVKQHPTPNIIGNDHDEPLWDNYDIPCWSLAALLGVFPEINGIPLTLEKVKAEDGYEGYYYHIEYKDIVLIPYSKNPVDACVELILRLKELNLL